jgi:broad specificity phosphatase PhoE
MTSILLIRHGHVAGIVPKRFRGRMDLPLSEEGRAQAAQAAAYVARRYAPEAIYSSPLQRCVDSAALLATQLSLPPPQSTQGLNDTDYGQWQGRLATEVEAGQPERFAQWRTAPQTVVFPGGESLANVAERATTQMQALAARHAGTIAVYTHDSVIRVVLLTAMDAPLSAYHRLEVDPCSLSELRYEPGGSIEIVRINERTAP